MALDIDEPWPIKEVRLLILGVVNELILIELLDCLHRHRRRGDASSFSRMVLVDSCFHVLSLEGVRQG